MGAAQRAIQRLSYGHELTTAPLMHSGQKPDSDNQFGELQSDIGFWSPKSIIRTGLGAAFINLGPLLRILAYAGAAAPVELQMVRSP
ncbi:MAG: hypothetical protein N2379_09070 [Verrucomicrobiae bacterium]|nr:hypothetical protein [Verrucomicrobiae bacterium]